MLPKKSFLLIVFALAWVIGLAQPVTIDPPSANIEPGESVTLTASGATYYTWSPATGLSTTEGPVTVASPMVTTTYTCSGYAPGAESVVNSGFEQGNVGFTSSYTYTNNLMPEGTYYVGAEANDYHTDFHGTAHDGNNFMIINGATTPGTNVWTEEITVSPNTYYAFSTWVCTVSPAGNAALLQFSINGNQIGNVFSAPATTYQWLQFYELWYSGNNTSATITILNQNTVGSGNDFGLDDVSFRELVLVGAPTCTVTVGSMTATATADEAELCEGESTTLHALPDGGSGNYSYSWTPANTLSNPNIQHPVATPSVGSTTYTCHITDNSWGTIQDVSVTVTVHPNYDDTMIYAFICSDNTFNFYGTEYNSSCVVSYTDHTIYGCDSIVRLNLTVYEDNGLTLNEVSLCPEQLPYVFYGENYYGPTDVTVIDTDIHGCDSAVRLVLTVNDYYIPEPVVVYTCEESYTWNPIGNYQFTFTESGFYTDTLPTDNCDGIFSLDLHFKQIPEPIVENVMACESYTWPMTGQTITESGDYYHYISLAPFPCEQVYQLHLTINPQALFDDEYISGRCDAVPVSWFGQDTVFLENTVYMFSGLTEEGCYREQTYHIEDMQYTPVTEGIHCQNDNAVVFGDTIAVVTNTEFFSFQYEFLVEETNLKCIWDSCTWTISKPSWVIEYDTIPENVGGRFRSKCKVYVADRDNDYVILKSTVKNDCGAKEDTFYLKSSFLEVDEQEVKADFSIAPNPNTGQMTLCFNHFTGKANVKVYDMTGNLIDWFEIDNHTEGQTQLYNLPGHASGVYFFIVTNEEGNWAKKVIINR